MKKLLYTIVLSFAIPFSIVAQTQEDELKNNQWYIFKVVLNSVDYLAPVNQERTDWEVNMSEFSYNTNAIHLYYCTSCTLQGIDFLPNNKFEADDMVCLAMNNCNKQLGNDNSDFLAKFYGVFQVPQPNAVFQYEVTDINSSTKQLKITNANGDEAYFHNAKLSITTHEFSKVTVFPNPVKNIVNVNLESVPQMNCKFIVYDISGKVVKVVEHASGNVISIDINNLTEGVYYLSVQNEKGIVQKTEKIIKK